MKGSKGGSAWNPTKTELRQIQKDLNARRTTIQQLLAEHGISYTKFRRITQERGVIIEFKISLPHHGAGSVAPST